jgi:hypothetical protein
VVDLVDDPAFDPASYRLARGVGVVEEFQLGGCALRALIDDLGASFSIEVED